MKIKALRHTVASGETLLAGKTYDVSETDARYLIRLGKAEEVAGKKAATKPPASEASAAPPGEDLLPQPEQ